MRRPKVQKMFAWAQYELDKRGAVLIFTARYIPWGRVAVNYVAGQTGSATAPSSGSTPSPASPGWRYSIGIGLLAGQWVHHNPLLGVGIAVVFAVVLGVVVDHVLRWWHKHLAKQGRHGSGRVTGRQPAGAREAQPAVRHPRTQPRYGAAMRSGWR